MADEGRRAKARRSTTEGQTVVFGEAVDERFAQHGIDPQSVRWDAHRREDGQWVLSAHWVGGQADRRADWSFHLSGRTVAPLDDTAADLLSDRPIRAILAPEPSDLETTSPNLTLAPPLAPGAGRVPGDSAHRAVAGRRRGLRPGPVRPRPRPRSSNAAASTRPWRRPSTRPRSITPPSRSRTCRCTSRTRRSTASARSPTSAWPAATTSPTTTRPPVRRFRRGTTSCSGCAASATDARTGKLGRSCRRLVVA